MKVLFFNPEHYVDYEQEPSNYELRLPIINCGAVTSYRDFVYQRVLREQGHRAMNQNALREAMEYRPDIIIYSTTGDFHSIDPRVLRKIMKAGIPVYIHVWDSYINSVKPKYTELEWFLNCTYFGVADSVSNYNYYRSILPYSKAKGVMFTPGHNVFTDLIRREEAEKIYDVVLLGSNEGHRAQLVQYLKEKLPQKGVKFEKIGGLVDSSKKVPHDKLRLTDQWVCWDRYAEILNQSKICISSQTVPWRCQVKGKIFDIMSCGALCLSDRNAETEKIIPEECIVYYENMEDCFNKIIYYIEHEDERAGIADAGYKWYHKTFNYKKFWSEFLNSAVNQSADLPVVESVEAAFRDYQKQTRRPAVFAPGVNPVKLRLILSFPAYMLAIIRMRFLELLRRAVGPVIYSKLQQLWGLMRNQKTGMADKGFTPPKV